MPRMTPLEFDAFQARRQVAQEVEAPRISKAVEREAQLHSEIIGELGNREWAFAHSRMDRATTTQKGIPDFIIFPKGSPAFCVECKSRSEKLTEDQLGFAARLRKLGGHNFYVVRSMDEFRQIPELMK